MNELNLLFSYIDSAIDGNTENIIKYFQKTDLQKSGYAKLSTVLDGFQDHKQQTEFCHKLLDLTKHISIDKNDESVNSLNSVQDKNLILLEIIAQLSKTYISEESRVAPESLFNVLVWLCDQLKNLYLHSSIQSKVCSVCELWYLQDRSNKDFIVPTMVTVLLNRSLKVDSKIVDIKRLNLCSSALKLIDFNSSKSNYLKILIQRTIIHALFLSKSEGHEFITYAFSELPHSLISSFHQTIKNSLSNAKKWQQQAYAQIYYKSYKISNGPNLLEIEKSIQDYVYLSIYLKNVEITKAIQIILKVFVDQRIKDRNTESMLYSVYSSILWESIQAPNPYIRSNSIEQLSFIFPLSAPELTQQEFENVLQEQFKLLSDALIDKFVIVRKQAILGFGRILSLYWDLLDVYITNTVMEFFVKKLVFDSDSSVRESVCVAIEAILQNTLAYNLVEKSLPSLMFLLSDRTEKVRIAFTSLLVAILRLTNTVNLNVVDLKLILTSLSTEKSLKVQKSLSKILSFVYWPNNASAKDLAARCLLFVEEHSQHVLPFYETVNLKDCELLIVVKFIHTIIKHVILPGLNSNKKANSQILGRPNNITDRIINSNKNVVSEKTCNSNLENTVVLLKIICAFWDKISLIIKKSENEKLYDYLIQNLDDNFFNLLLERVNDSVIYKLANYLPSKNIPQFSLFMFNMYNDLGSISVNHIKHIPNLKTEHLSNLLNQIVKCLDINNSLTINYERTKKGLNILNCLMCSSESTLRAVISHTNTNKLIEVLDQYHRHIELVLDEEINHQISNNCLVLALSLYYKLILYANAFTNKSVIGLFENAINWVSRLLKTKFREFLHNNLLDCETDETPLPELMFFFNVSNSLLVILTDFLLLNCIPEKTMDRLKDLFCWILKIRSKQNLLDIVCMSYWKLYANQQVLGKLVYSDSINYLTLSVIFRDPQETVIIRNLRLLIDRAFKYDLTSPIPILVDHIINYVCEQLDDVDMNFDVDIDVNGESLRSVNLILSVVSSHINTFKLYFKEVENKCLSDIRKINIWIFLQIIRLVSSRTKKLKLLESFIQSMIDKINLNLNDSDPEENKLKLKAKHIFNSLRVS